MAPLQGAGIRASLTPGLASLGLGLNSVPPPGAVATILDMFAQSLELNSAPPPGAAITNMEVFAQRLDHILRRLLGQWLQFRLRRFTQAPATPTLLGQGSFCDAPHPPSRHGSDRIR